MPTWSWEDWESGCSVCVTPPVAGANIWQEDTQTFSPGFLNWWQFEKRQSFWTFMKGNETKYTLLWWYFLNRNTLPLLLMETLFNPLVPLGAKFQSTNMWPVSWRRNLIHVKLGTKNFVKCVNPKTFAVLKINLMTLKFNLCISQMLSIQTPEMSPFSHQRIKKLVPWEIFCIYVFSFEHH